MDAGLRLRHKDLTPLSPFSFIFDRNQSMAGRGAANKRNKLSHKNFCTGDFHPQLTT
jgi:hypothetical protein